LGLSRNPTKEFKLMLAALGLGPALRGYDKLDYALPMEQDEIKELATAMIQNRWTLPSYNIQQGA